MTFRDDWVSARRVFILRLLVKTDGEANESIIFAALEHGGFSRDSRDAYRADLDHLRQQSCISEEWFDDMRVVRITERGQMAAQGRLEVAGVQRSSWQTN